MALRRVLTAAGVLGCCSGALFTPAASCAGASPADAKGRWPLVAQRAPELAGCIRDMGPCGRPFFPERCDFSCTRGVGVLCAPPYAATHVPLALVVTQRRQAFWQLALVAGSFDRFVNSARRLVQAGVSA